MARTRFLTVGAGWSIAWALALAGCNDFTTGQPGEPEGPLTITKLTLLDQDSRDVPIFTDNCNAPDVKDTPKCQGDVFRELYGLGTSPPNPDSGEFIRVVFDKVPLLLSGMQVEKVNKQPMQPPDSLVLADMSVVDLGCDAPCQVPPLLKTLQITGTPLSPTPTDPRFAYGPALQVQVMPDDMHPLAALEPDSLYRITVNPGLSGRDGNKVLLDADTIKLLQFTTEPFQVLQVGIGDTAGDPYVYAESSHGTGTAATPYRIERLSRDGVVALKMNAGVFEPALSTPTATVDGQSVAVKIGLSQLTTDTMGKMMCDPGKHRTIYLYPGTKDRMWDPKAMQLTVTLHGADIHDISQGTGHPDGRHRLSGDVVITAQFTDKPADYMGITSDKVSDLADCPAH